MASRVSATVFSPHVDSALIRRKLAQCSQHYKSAKLLPIKRKRSLTIRPDPFPITAISAITAMVSLTFHCFWIFTRSILRHKYFLLGASRRVVFSSGDLSRAQRTLKSAAESLFCVLFPSDCRICHLPLTNISALPVCNLCLAQI